MSQYAGYVSLVLNWIIFLAMFPISFVWLRRAWRIVVKRDFSEVALKRGESPHNPERFAPYAAAINLVCGIVLVCVIFGVMVVQLPYANWTAIAGITIWCKFFFDFILSRHAHPVQWGRKGKGKVAAAKPEDRPQ
ncbi:MAG: hypothetical protein KDH15_19005 [Rhodocyclaceae bacterium]|nr:hypothetical protein [Rhodocyclaceae bacterium]